MIRNVDDFTLFTYSFRSVLFRCEFLLIRNHSGPSGSLQIWCIDYINYCKSLQLRPIFTAIVRYFPSSIFHKLHRNTTKIILYNSSKFNFLKQLIDMIYYLNSAVLRLSVLINVSVGFFCQYTI